MKLTDLKVSSFTTSEKSTDLKGGTSATNNILCDETITVIYGTCSYPCYDIP